MSSASDKSDATAASRLISSAAAPRVDFLFLLWGSSPVDEKQRTLPAFLVTSEMGGDWSANAKTTLWIEARLRNESRGGGAAALSLKIRTLVLDSDKGIHPPLRGVDWRNFVK